MSKSKPSSAIFMEDTPEAVNEKIKNSFCPEKKIANNPCFDYLKHIVLQKLDTFVVERPEKFGGKKFINFFKKVFLKWIAYKNFQNNRVYNTYEEIVEDFESGKLHPGDLKPALAKALNQIIQPVQQHFVINPHAKEVIKITKKINYLFNFFKFKLLEKVRGYMAELHKPTQEK